jgi:hypothetical protein
MCSGGLTECPFFLDHYMQSLQGTSDPELRQLTRKLMVQVELADDACKHPNTLTR